jgi:hypothetical protein
MNSGEQNYWQSAQKEEPQATAAPSVPQPQGATPTPLPTPNNPAGVQPAPSVSPTPPAFAPPPPMALPTVPKKPEQTISWEASEFIHRPKGVGWFLGFLVFAIALLGFGLFILRDFVTTGGFVIMLVAIIVVAVRPPRVLRYVIDGSGVHVGEKLYPYQQFQSYGVLQEGGVWSILLMPTGRFQPPLSIYFSREEGEKIVDILGTYLPMEEHKPDIIDRLSSKLRF